MAKPSRKKGILKDIEQGELIHTSGRKIPFKIVHGWHPKSSLECDLAWKTGWIDLLTELQAHEPDENKQAEIFAKIAEDFEWRWFDKAMLSSSDEYEWFHLHADGKPQAACLIYHPKKSILEPGDIFYVEFLAVAPWNRKCGFRPREFAGIGKKILRAAQHFAVQELKLRPGFCLHSLPKAEGFYINLKMVKVPGHTKEGILEYFELTEALATELMEAS